MLNIPITARVITIDADERLSPRLVREIGLDGHTAPTD